MCCCWYCRRKRLCRGRRFYVDVSEIGKIKGGFSEEEEEEKKEGERVRSATVMRALRS